MSKNLGKCHFCEDGFIEVREINSARGKIKLYACCNAKWNYEFDMAELKEDASCGFRIFSNALLKWNKRSIGEKEIRELLQTGSVKVRLFSSRAKKEYYKRITLDREYGVSVLWNEEL